MDKKFYVSPAEEIVKLSLESVILSGSDGFEEPEMGGSEGGYSDPSEFDPS